MKEELEDFKDKYLVEPTIKAVFKDSDNLESMNDFLRCFWYARDIDKFVLDMGGINNLNMEQKNYIKAIYEERVNYLKREFEIFEFDDSRLKEDYNKKV